MLSKISRFVAIATLTTLTCVITHPSEAQPVNSEQSSTMDIVESNTPINMNQLVNQAFSEHSGNFFEQASIGGQLNTIFGWRNFPQGSFPENNITRDGLLLNAILSDYFKQLQEKEPTIRTRDIPNPFNSSVGEDPNYIR
ncbi:hypothetical protein GM3708_2503 [Geminocystis sp. NIES-3708]|uniref:hypothetical protein n=1 Tax=Geminocystis sp. NIES-3708 TaxID=1615909 RepID=UPI0005FCB9B1|nr:hypothetical protein [Geminocystis sp. NIES-3708]BAQ62097.1 hypothetical protein GM3708_2503 [Geminocystis sp. NIES-3708]